MSLRLFKIVWVVTRHRLDTLIPAERLPLWMRLLLKLSPLQLVPLGQRSRGERLRLALEALGPIFIKFGQMLSTRRDLLPEAPTGSGAALPWRTSRRADRKRAGDDAGRSLCRL